MKNFKICLLIVFLSFIFSCKGNQQQYIGFPFEDEKLDLDSMYRPLNSKQLYFPVEVRKYSQFDTLNIWRDLKEGRITTEKFYELKYAREESDYLEAKMFSNILFQLDEPLLSKKYLNEDIFRLLGYTSASNIFILRITRKGRIIEVICKKGKASSVIKNYVVQYHIHHTSKHTVDIANWEKLINVADNSGFWTRTPITIDDRIDGETYILEGHSKNGYRAITRSSISGMYKDEVKVLFQTVFSFYNCVD